MLRNDCGGASHISFFMMSIARPPLNARVLHHATVLLKMRGYTYSERAYAAKLYRDLDIPSMPGARQAALATYSDRARLGMAFAFAKFSSDHLIGWRGDGGMSSTHFFCRYDLRAFPSLRNAAAWCLLSLWASWQYCLHKR